MCRYFTPFFLTLLILLLSSCLAQGLPVGFTPKRLPPCESFLGLGGWQESSLEDKIRRDFVRLHREFGLERVLGPEGVKYEFYMGVQMEAEEILASEIKSGNPLYQSYLDLGFTLKNSPKPRLERPQSLGQLYLRLLPRLIAKAQEEKLRLDEMVLPGLLFQRELQVGVLEFLIITPGVDSLPEKTLGWRLADEVHSELDYFRYAHGLKGRRMPLMADMLLHDLGHISQGLESASDLVSIHKYYLRSSEFLGEVPEFKRAHVQKRLQLVDNWFNEFFETLKKEQIPRLKSGLPLLIEADRLKAGGADQQWFKEKLRQRFSSAELQSHLAEILRAYYSSFRQHGGGIRDGYSVRSFAFASPLRSRFLQIFGEFKVPRGNYDIAAQDLLYGLIVQMQELQRMMQLRLDHPLAQRHLENLSFSSRNQSEALDEVLQAFSKVRLEGFYVDAMAEFYFRVHKMLKFNLSFQEVLRDLSDLKNFSRSRTAQFVRETSAGDSTLNDLIRESQWRDYIN